MYRGQTAQSIWMAFVRLEWWSPMVNCVGGERGPQRLHPCSAHFLTEVFGLVIISVIFVVIIVGVVCVQCCMTLYIDDLLYSVSEEISVVQRFVKESSTRLPQSQKMAVKGVGLYLNIYRRRHDHKRSKQCRMLFVIVYVWRDTSLAVLWTLPATNCCPAAS